MKGRFDPELKLLRNGKVRVAGPFNPESKDVHKATVLFMIVQGDGGPDTVIVQGETTWERDPRKTDSKQAWSADVSVTGKRPGGGRGRLRIDAEHPVIRGIAMAIAVKPVQRSAADRSKFDPPAFEVLTWCADTKLAR